MSDSYHHGNLREVIMHEAVKQIIKEGIDSLSLRKVARAIGVSHNAPYRHFQTVGDLLAALAHEGFSKLYDYLSKHDRGETAVERLVNSGVGYFRFAVDYPAHVNLIFRWQSFAEYANDELNEISEKAFECLHGIVKDGVSSGEFHDADSHMMALSAWAQVHGYASLYQMGVIDSFGIEADPAEIFQAIATPLVSGFQADV